MAEIHFASPEIIQQTMGSAEGHAVDNDLANFASGRVKLIIGSVE